MREKMAVIHERMAKCLRSEKTLTTCRQEMQTSCSDMMGEQGCPMMGMGMHGRMTKAPQEHGPALPYSPRRPVAAVLDSSDVN
jgi:hypothetical protein